MASSRRPALGHADRGRRLRAAQGAKAYELRTATRFAVFLHARGLAAEARAVLAPIHASFTEGFDNRDLVEAKSLLAELT